MKTKKRCSTKKRKLLPPYDERAARAEKDIREYGRSLKSKSKPSKPTRSVSDSCDHIAKLVAKHGVPHHFPPGTVHILGIRGEKPIWTYEPEGNSAKLEVYRNGGRVVVVMTAGIEGEQTSITFLPFKASRALGHFLLASGKE